jgi:hypothetical protein
VNGNGLTNFLYDGDDLIGEYDSGGTLIRRTVHGPGTDEPIVVYEGGTKKWLYADPQGSIIAQADGSGNNTATLSYGPGACTSEGWWRARPQHVRPLRLHGANAPARDRQLLPL